MQNEIVACTMTCTLHIAVQIIVTQYNVGYINYSMIAMLEHMEILNVLMWYTHLIAAAGNQLHHVPLAFLINQVVSYHPVCTNKNSTCGYYDIHTSTGVNLL